jgi:hypothetical protein
VGLLLLIVIAAVVALSVVGAGVAALVYFLTRDTNGREVDPDQDLLRRTAMIKVTVIGERAGMWQEVGTIEFHGLAIPKPGGSTRASRSPFLFECNPRHIVSHEFALQVANDLSRGLTVGRIDGDEWRMEQPADPLFSLRHGAPSKNTG